MVGSSIGRAVKRILTGGGFDTRSTFLLFFDSPGCPYLYLLPWYLLAQVHRALTLSGYDSDGGLIFGTKLQS